MPRGVYARGRPASPELKQKIQTAQIINRLQDDFMGKVTPALTRNQIREAEILLRKTMPDLSTHHVEGHVQHSFVDFLRALEQRERGRLEPARPMVEISAQPDEVRH